MRDVAAAAPLAERAMIELRELIAARHALEAEHRAHIARAAERIARFAECLGPART